MTERERRALLKRRPNIASWASLFAQARAAGTQVDQGAVSA
jgi:WhiB family redox-sensing transcriptional regulator